MSSDNSNPRHLSEHPSFKWGSRRRAGKLSTDTDGGAQSKQAGPGMAKVRPRTRSGGADQEEKITHTDSSRGLRTWIWPRVSWDSYLSISLYLSFLRCRMGGGCRRWLGGWSDVRESQRDPHMAPSTQQFRTVGLCGPAVSLGWGHRSQQNQHNLLGNRA